MIEARDRRVRRRLMSYIVALLAVIAVSATLPFTGLLLTGDGQAIAQQGAATVGDSFGSDTNPRANFWRAVREGDTGYSAIQGREAGVLIQNGGENYRMLRNGPVLTYGAGIMLLVLIVIFAYHLLNGQVKIDGGRSGRLVQRWTTLERLLHWVTAISFVLLLITGLSMAFGRDVLIPAIGRDAFSAYASLARSVHNYVGPVFAVSLVLLLLKFLPSNFPNRTDWEWFKRGGGLIGKAHPSAGRMNAGEKFWFWLLMTFGMAVVVTGLLLDFSAYFELTRSGAQISVLIHAACAMIVMAVAFGHVYLGTAGTEGALEGMTTGSVDEAWARQHHDLWLEEVKRKGGGAAPASSAGSATGAGAPQTAST
ncbi:MAG: formate dehydrogenase subunit gamma [Burkholderiales bacterium]|nr:MAG: formate dehydrogenase subunit gamma [Burkholderiales bacterium]